MSDRRSFASASASRKFVPDMGSLEGRVLLSRQVAFPDGASFNFPTFVHLPRTGGTMIQSGTALTLGVGQRKSNSVNITDPGPVAQTIEWNGRAQHEVANVQAFLVQAGRSGRDQITIDLGASTAFATPTASSTTTAAGVPRDRSHPVSAFSRRTSGTAVQTGTVLNIMVTGPRINEISVSSLNSGQEVQTQWRGGAIQTFAGISTIIVDMRNGTTDFVALDNTNVKTV